MFSLRFYGAGRGALLKERNFQYYSQIGGKVEGILLNDVESFMIFSSWNFLEKSAHELHLVWVNIFLDFILFHFIRFSFRNAELLRAFSQTFKKSVQMCIYL